MQARLMVIGALSECWPDTAMAYDLMKRTGMSSGRVYTALIGLHREGKVSRTEAYRPSLDRDVFHWGLVK